MLLTIVIILKKHFISNLVIFTERNAGHVSRNGVGLNMTCSHRNAQWCVAYRDLNSYSLDKCSVH